MGKVRTADSGHQSGLAAITEIEIAAAQQGRGRGTIELVDGLEAGLRLRVTGAAARWYVLARTGGGLRARIPLGVWPTLAVDDARSAARAIKQNLASIAAPVEEGPATVGAVLDRYKTRRLSQLRKGLVMGRAIDAALSSLRHRELVSLSRKEISRLVDDLADRAPIQANRTLAYLKALFSWAHGRAYIDDNPIRGISKPTREVARERTPTVEEIADIWAAAQALGYPFGPIVKLLILTAARRDEVGAIRVDELHLPPNAAEGWWVIPAGRSKNGRSLRIPLSASARVVVEEALKLRPQGSRFLFSTTTDSAVSGWSRAKTRLDRFISQSRQAKGRESIEPWRLHDLRRSFATSACDALGVDPAVADRCLNHVGAATSSTISRVYARNEMYDQRADALRRWAEFIGQAIFSEK
jgi:integrase